MTTTDLSTRAAYSVRVNVHNRRWDGTICVNPTRNDDCHGRDEFKSGVCAKGMPRCFFLSLFAREPSLRLPKSQSTYEKVFDEQPPEAGDLAIFWGTYADGTNAPVGMWNVSAFDASQPAEWIVRGDPRSAVVFAPKVASHLYLDARVRRSIGGEMLRLLPASNIHTVLERFLGDHEAQLGHLSQFGQNTDDVRDAISGLRAHLDRLPDALQPHLSTRITFSDDDLQLLGLTTKSSTELSPPDGPQAADDPGPDATAAPLPFPSGVIADYRIAVQVSSLVILAGPSGAGKTQLTRSFAESIGARYTLVAVRPDWRTNEDLLGYLPPFGGDFQPTEFVRFVAEANAECAAARADGREPVPFHVCLDEMNLARPEYYMAEVLSKMELDGDLRALRLYDADGERGIAPVLPLPPNVVVIGTVNNDDTTHALAPKVLDRAVYLHIDEIDLASWFARRPGPVASKIAPQIIELDSILAAAGTRIGYRVAGQVVRWVQLAGLGQSDLTDGLDTAIATLVLARVRVQRTETAHQAMLDQLLNFLDRSDANGEELYPRSAAAARRLKERLQRHEFAYGQFET